MGLLVGPGDGASLFLGYFHGWQQGVVEHLDGLVLGGRDEVVVQVQHYTLDLAVEPVDLGYFGSLADFVLFLGESIEVDDEDEVISLPVDGCSPVVAAQEEIVNRGLQTDLTCGGDETVFSLVL